MSKASRLPNKKAVLQRLAQDINMADPTSHATFRFMDRAWNRTGKHLRKALDEYDQEEAQRQSNRSQ